jgi:DNA-binding response OmpR family regulator
VARILVVDDDPDIQEVCRLVLEMEGHEVCGAASREEGMAAAAARAPDLLMLDVMLEQDNDGVAMAHELRGRGFTRPILMLSGLSRDSTAAADEGGVLPVDDFQEKPIDPGALIAKVAALLAGGRPATEA